jgi:hypothetical protein
MALIIIFTCRAFVAQIAASLLNCNFRVSNQFVLVSIWFLKLFIVALPYLFFDPYL